MKKLIALGAGVAVEAGAGVGASVADADYEAAGAAVGARGEVLNDAGIVLAVQGPGPATLAGLKAGALLIGALNPFGRFAADRVRGSCRHHRTRALEHDRVIALAVEVARVVEPLDQELAAQLLAVFEAQLIVVDRASQRVAADELLGRAADEDARGADATERIPAPDSSSRHPPLSLW